MKKYVLLLAMAAVVAGLTTACTDEDSVLDTPAAPEQPVEQPEVGKVHITVGAGINDGDDDATRSAVVLDKNTSGARTRTLRFTKYDRLYVRGVIPHLTPTFPIFLTGYLDIDTYWLEENETVFTNDGTSAMFSGDLTVYVPNLEDMGGNNYVFHGYNTPTDYPFATSDPLSECNILTVQLVHGNTGGEFKVNDDDNGSINDYLTGAYTDDWTWQVDPDVETLMKTRLNVTATSYDAENRRFTLTPGDNSAILNCTIAGLRPDATYQVTMNQTHNINYPANYTYGTTEASADGTASFAILASNQENYYFTLTLTNTDDASDTYVKNLGRKTFAKKVYNLTELRGGTTRNLNEISDNEVTLDDGDIITGDAHIPVMIADGATVMLKNANIHNQESGAAIECLGDATIILSGTNRLTGGHGNAGIFVPESSTLTIRGNGKLTVQGGSEGAGIGSGTDTSAGKIVIEGGDITATGGVRGAGIGCGYAKNQNTECGTITIRGGMVKAQGGNSAAGIGCGQCSKNPGCSKCGQITISGGIVEATGGSSGAGIGSGYGSKGMSECMGIEITNGTVTAQGGSGGAGIGSGEVNTGTSACRAINISGGTIMAKGGDGSAGIGCGKGNYLSNQYHKSECGDITFQTSEYFVYVSATRGSGASYGANYETINPYPVGLSCTLADTDGNPLYCSCGEIYYPPQQTLYAGRGIEYNTRYDGAIEEGLMINRNIFSTGDETWTFTMNWPFYMW